jgi:hypothetical protein
MGGREHVGIFVTSTCTANRIEAQEKWMKTEAKKIVYLLAENGIGRTQNLILRQKLTLDFFDELKRPENQPGAICFITEAVRLTCSASPYLQVLRELDAAGVLLLVCQSSLAAFDLVNEFEIGVAGGMDDLAKKFSEAPTVISI